MHDSQSETPTARYLKRNRGNAIPAYLYTILWSAEQRCKVAYLESLLCLPADRCGWVPIKSTDTEEYRMMVTQCSNSTCRPHGVRLLSIPRDSLFGMASTSMGELAAHRLSLFVVI
jgi:hypothetical protein